MPNRNSVCRVLEDIRANKNNRSHDIGKSLKMSPVAVLNNLEILAGLGFIESYFDDRGVTRIRLLEEKR